MLNKCKEKDTHQEFFFIDESDTIGLSGLQICLLFRFIDYMFNVIANMKVQWLLYFARMTSWEKSTAPAVLIVMKEYATQIQQYGSFMCLWIMLEFYSVDGRQKQCQALT